ncbi:hypothetical protein BG58_07445 [Caballeronia jiangsuensis]|nr:hypothetical protein BG58_07445 [Caballeronia jiangsuensis]
MADHRPPELTSHIEREKDKNDTLILDALGQLEDPQKRGKRKATVAVICKITGLSRNTIRNRQWALDRLKAIKKKLKSGSEPSAGSEPTSEQTETTPSMLRARIKRILEQNALLYEEILSLQSIIERKDSEINALKTRKNLSIVPPVGGASE